MHRLAQVGDGGERLVLHGTQRLERLGGEQRRTVAPRDGRLVRNDQFVQVVDRVAEREDDAVADHAETDYQFQPLDLVEDFFQLLLMILQPGDALANQIGVGLDRERDHLTPGHLATLE